MNFLDVKTDLAFKKVFASDGNKDILISFLNAILYAEKTLQIIDLTVVDPDSIPLIKGMKDTYVDVKAILNDDTQVIIEIQILNFHCIEERILYNAAKNYSVQLKKGEHYSLLNPVIALTLVDFTLFDQYDDVISRFKLIEKKHMIDYSDDIELVFVELPKFTTTFEQLDTSSVTDQWIYFIKHAGDMDFIPESFSATVNKAFTLIDESAMSEAELEIQHKQKDFIFIQNSSLALAIETGYKEGREQGLKEALNQKFKQGHEEGLAQAKLDIARNLLASGISVDQVVQLTSLSLSQVKTLKDAMKG